MHGRLKKTSNHRPNKEIVAENRQKSSFNPSVASGLFARLSIIAMLTLIGLIVIEPSSASSHHPNIPPMLREEYYSSVPGG